MVLTMKKYIPLLFLLWTVPLSAAELEYPIIVNNGTILINAGIGFAKPIISGAGKRMAPERKCPPLTVSLDYALPIAGLPLTLGLITGFFSETAGPLQFDYWPVAGRIGYHLSFNVPRLDAYALLTLGGMSWWKNSIAEGKRFWMGVSAGARYFFLPHFGAYAELGFDTVQNLTFGVTFNF